MNMEWLMTTILNDKDSARSTQKAVGPSEIGGCRRRLWHRIQQTPITNEDTLGLAAWMGTAIHERIQRRIKHEDPFGKRFLVEHEVEYDGLMGHVDLYDMQEQEVIDWKTTTKKNLGRFPSAAQRQQVQLYGYLMEHNHRPVANVTLVALARDGNELDIKQHTEPYDERYALEALARWREVAAMDAPPEPEENVRFCRDYCQFWDPSAEVGCPGKEVR
jgi:hypothetical protein